MKNNLKPEKRLDKNGRLVTKHVLTAEPPKRNSLSIPKVFAVKQSMGIFGAGSHSPALGWETVSHKVTDMLAHLDQDHLYKLRDIVSTADARTKEQLQKLIVNSSSAASVAGYPDRVHPEVQYAALVLPILNVAHSNTGGFSAGNVGILWSNAKFDLGNSITENVLDGDDSEQSLAKGYCFMTQAGYYRAAGDHRTTDEDMKWIGEHIDALLPHFDRIVALPGFDRELCESLVNAESPSLSSGLL